MSAFSSTPSRAFALALIANLALAPPGMAQSTPSPDPQPSSPSKDTTAVTPAPDTPKSVSTISSSEASTGAVIPPSSPPGLTVASVKLEGGSRASKIIGASVYNDANQKVGTVDDLILKDKDKVVMAIISVGGFLGIGSKLVAVGYDQLTLGQDKVVFAGGNKEALNGMPSFTYGS